MAMSPDSLQNICLDYVAADMCTLSDCCSGNIPKKLSSVSPSPLYCHLHCSDHVYLHSNLADALLSRIADKKKLCCETLSAFTPKSTSLRRIKIKSPSSLRYHKELQMLNQHQIIDFSYEEGVSKLNRAVVNKLIACLSKWSRANLRSLNVTGCTFLDPAGAAVVISLVSLRELRTLNVSRTEFNDNMLKIVVSELPKLESIDISSTFVTDLSPLSKCSDRLRFLAMYNVRVNGDSAIDVVCSMSKIRHLDVSSDSFTQTFITNSQDDLNINRLIYGIMHLETLVSLDISGKQDVDIHLLR